MTFAFEPPLQLAGTPMVVVRSLDDAAGFLQGYIGRWPVTRDLILRRLNAASTEQEASEAAKTFRWWAGLEGLLLWIPCLVAFSPARRFRKMLQPK